MIVNQENLGLVPNWNRCVSLAKGTWLKFVFQDDVIEFDCIQRMLEARQGDVPLIVCRRDFIFEAEVSESVRDTYRDFLGRKSVRFKFPGMSLISPQEFCLEFLENPTENWLGEPTATLIHRSAFDRYGLFNPGLASLCDWEFWARVAVNTGFYYLDYKGASFRVHSDSESAKQRVAAVFKIGYLDPLIVRHEMAYAPAYAPARRCAAQQKPPVNLIQRLLYAAHDAERRAEEYAYDPVAPNTGPLSEWRIAARRYPRFQSMPVSYVLDWAKRKASSVWNPA
jgi:hypothetical protein